MQMSATKALSDAAACLSNLTICDEASTSSEPVTRASTKVFAIPELVENILDHITSPLELFALGRVSTVFHDTIGMQKNKVKVFLEPSASPKLRVFHLTKLLLAKGLWNSLYPFRFAGLTYRERVRDEDAHQIAVDQIVLKLQVDREWARENYSKAKQDIFDDSLPYKREASWQSVRLGDGKRQLRVEILN